jgi:hypothetical protein
MKYAVLKQLSPTGESSTVTVLYKGTKQDCSDLLNDLAVMYKVPREGETLDITPKEEGYYLSTITMVGDNSLAYKRWVD